MQPVPNADYVLPIEIDGTVHNVYVLKRPHVDEFLEAVGKLFEVVLFTASLPKVGPVCTALAGGPSLFAAFFPCHRGGPVSWPCAVCGPRLGPAGPTRIHAASALSGALRVP